MGMAPGGRRASLGSPTCLKCELQGDHPCPLWPWGLRAATGLVTAQLRAQWESWGLLDYEEKGWRSSQMACLRALSALGWVRQEDPQGNLFVY